jgi:hypothetical protein
MCAVSTMSEKVIKIIRTKMTSSSTFACSILVDTNELHDMIRISLSHSSVHTAPFHTCCI